MNPDSPAVELIDVSKHFEEAAAPAVHHVSLAIGQGEFFSLLGPSGCGKTTTLRMIAGFEHPTSGTLRLLGADIGDLPPHRRNVNMVFQNYALFPHLSVFDNVAFGLEVKRVPRDEIRRQVLDALEMVRLPGLEKRKPAQLSGGQQQRVALARALVNRPAVLLLDEPLGALDQKLRKDMQRELKLLQREVGITFIYVTHDQEEALTMSDRIAVMHGGRVLQVAPPRELYDRPASRYVADFIGTTNFLEGTYHGGREDAALVDVPGLGQVLAGVVDGLAQGQAVTLAIRPEWMRLRPGPDRADQDRADPNRVEATLEDIVYIGNDTQYFVRLPGGQSVIVREQNQLPQAAPTSVGERVTVSWAAASAIVLVE